MINTLGIMFEIRVEILKTIHGPDSNSNLSQDIFAIDTWRAVICSLGHGRKLMLTILPTIWRPGFKPGLHMVVRVAEHACDDASKRILKPSTYRLQIFLVRNQYLRSLLPHGDQGIAEVWQEIKCYCRILAHILRNIESILVK